MAALPGTQLFAPQARLVDATSNNVVGSSSSSGSTPNPADLDLVSAKITLGLSNVCQLQVVLNNQQFAHGMPVHPPWKYNDLSRIYFGQRLRLDVRYGGDKWTKMILARVTDLQFSFPSGGAAQITVVGEDLLSLLKTKSTSEKRYSERTEDFIVRDTLVRANSGLTFTGTATSQDGLSGPLVPWPELSPLKSITHPNKSSYLQFLQDIAERMDFEMFIDFTERQIDDKTPKDEHRSDVKLHFEPARSLIDPKQPVVLAFGLNLVDFTPKFKVWEQLTGVTIAGTKAGARGRHTVTIGVTDAEIEKDLKKPAGQEGDKTFDAGKARAKFFGPQGKEGKSSDNAPSVDSANLDEKRAKLKGIAMLRKSMRELLTATGSTYGMPNLRPGVYVEIAGMYAPFDGYYYVTDTVHTVDGSGYRTQFTLRRPGMLDPSNYPAQEKAKS